jgi:hypothetical protein
MSDLFNALFRLPLFQNANALSAEAQHPSEAWGSAPRLMVSETPALKMRIISGPIETRLQRLIYAAI